jgi:hypothetical protein
MRGSRGYSQFQLRAVVGAALLLVSAAALAVSPEALLQQTNEYPHARTIDFGQKAVIDYEVGLGAIQKTGGAWRFKHSERFSGYLTSYTWQIVDGFTSLEVLDELVTAIEAMDASELLFDCEARSCGPSVQWANRVFHQRVLYGTEKLQRYRVYSVEDDGRYLVIIYASARTADRQYLHAALLKVEQ